MKRRLFAAAAAGVVLAVALLLALRRGAAAPEPALDGRSVYLLDSAFVTDDGRAVRLRELRGHFQVTALIFTRCPKACPTLVKQLQALERRLPDGAREATRFALITIDPEHDTPEALRSYRQRMGLGPSFTLLRGDAGAVRELAASIGVGYGEGDGLGLLHSRLVTLLDPGGVVVHQQAGLEHDAERLIDALAGRMP